MAQKANKKMTYNQYLKKYGTIFSLPQDDMVDPKACGRKIAKAVMRDVNIRLTQDK